MTMSIDPHFIMNVHDNQPGGLCLLDWYEGEPEPVAYADTFPKMRHEIAQYVEDTDGECDLMVVRVVCKTKRDEGVYRVAGR